MSPAQTQSLAALGVTIFVVFRFALRELKERTIRRGRVWIRPAILIVLTIYLVVLTLQLDRQGVATMIAALIAGAAIGVVTGALVLRFTTIRPAASRGAIVVLGSRATVAVWFGALVLRLLARYAVPHGADPRTQLPMNCGTVALVAAAFVVIAAAFSRAIARPAA